MLARDTGSMMLKCIPCRYANRHVHPREEKVREQSADGATHAWVEALLPRLGGASIHQQPAGGDAAHPDGHRTRLA
jgi:hypothetical protein